MRATLPVLVGLMAILYQADSVNGQVDKGRPTINIFEINLNESLAKGIDKSSCEFSPPNTPESKFSWVANSFGPCFGCGNGSYKEVRHDCIHRLPDQRSHNKTITGVFRVPGYLCSETASLPKPVSVRACGPPCSELRLLRDELTGCRCDHNRKIAFDVPKLVCRNNKNCTVSLSLCKFFYEENTLDYRAESCDYATVCSGKIAFWIARNWTQCGHENSMYQTRDVICVTKPAASRIYYFMHESMCSACSKPPRMQPCARWAAEKNFANKCNCSTGKVSRRVLCMRDSPKANGPKRKALVDEAECSWHTKPDSERPCNRRQLFADCGGVTSRP